jgi:prepilin-type N-terminal cleavage/methylation domain-containing protein
MKCVKKAKKHYNTGFSLIEMSVVLAIISSIIGAMIVLTGKVQERSKYEATLSNMQIIHNALTAYGRKGGVLPCPARRDLAPTHVDFGKATDCNAVVTAGITEIGQVRIGVVPVRALSLPDELMFDDWNMRILYAVDKNLAIDATTFTAYTKPVAGGITLLDGSGNNIIDSNVLLTKLFPAYILLSHGQDKKGATNKLGNTTNTCTAGNADTLNCGNTGSFRDTVIKRIATTSASYFDDIMLWRTYDFLDNDNHYTDALE